MSKAAVALVVPQSSGQFLTLKQVAKYLNVSPQTVRRLALAGEIRFFRVRTEYRFRDTWVEDYIEGRGRRKR